MSQCTREGRIEHSDSCLLPWQCSGSGGEYGTAVMLGNACGIDRGRRVAP